MKIFINIFILAVIATCLSGCATGVKFSKLQADLAPVDSELGRIFFYRSSSCLFYAPDILLNYKVVGKAIPKGFFYVDVPPGNYEVTHKKQDT